jgi:hypothetical protein
MVKSKHSKNWYTDALFKRGGPSLVKTTHFKISHSNPQIWRLEKRTVIQKQMKSNRFATKTENNNFLT